MSRDEAQYKNPNDFNPDRFFTADGQLNDDTVSFPFGFGRRVCIGKHFADASLWIAIVSLLATFRFMRPLDSDGKEVDPIFEWTTGLVSQVSCSTSNLRDRCVLISEINRHPVSLPCRVLPRHPGMTAEKLADVINLSV
jgi:hypothetical protein